ncbi:hypothetical protein CIT292_09396 [Citrobacter youngae ATCC 29220]|uniref:Uncharacterized protein n=1 Tax=Citrobacter youngae ATCC 29220 TaxID=500640 RepID=D4BF31_9ENTR|nr:hypothetical protein CIT292_09396 [Citrobacter youngae ATCC 29220]
MQITFFHADDFAGEFVIFIDKSLACAWFFNFYNLFAFNIVEPADNIENFHI